MADLSNGFRVLLLLLVLVVVCCTQAPNRPQNLRTSDVRTTSAILRWSDQLNTGRKILHFAVFRRGFKYYNTTFKDIKQENVPPNVHEKHVTGLVPGTRYTLSAAGVNAAGFGDESKVIIDTSAEAAPAPDEPKLLRNSEPFTNVDIRFLPSSNINGPISFYQVIVYQTKGTVASLPVNFEHHLTNYQNATADNLDYWIAWIIYPDEMPCKMTIGDGKTRGLYTNVPLHYSKNSGIFIRTATTTGNHTLYGKPSTTSVIRILSDYPQLENPEITATELTIPLLLPTRNVRYVKIIVLEQSLAVIPHKPSEYREDEIVSYEVARNSSNPRLFVAAVLGANDFKSMLFRLGNDSKTQYHIRQDHVIGYHNAPLKPGKFYSVFQRFYYSEDVYYSSNWLKPISTSASVKSWSASEMIKSVFCKIITVLLILFFTALCITAQRAH